MPEVLHPVVVQVVPVAVFLLAITVTAEVAQLAGVFDVAAHALAHRAHHRVVLLWLTFAALAVASTIVLSLDTTAVLLTPVGLAVARQTGIAPMPFALTTLWIARLAPAVGSGTRALDLLHLSGASALAANLVDNLPAYLLVEPSAADDARRLVATLVGVNAGALVTPRASLATLLWLQRCRSAGLQVPLLRLAGWGAICATLCVTAATLTIR